MAGRVEGKVALVTGAASGIGRGSAVGLAAEGARVLLADVDEAGGQQAAKEIGGDAAFFAHDVSDEGSWQRAMAEAEQRYGRLDVLVNNAGIVILADIESASLDDYQRIQAVNAQGVFLGCKHAIPAMRRAGGGSIINVSSVAAMIATTPYPAYAASKGAVRALTKTVAIHCRDKGDAIRCNSIHPGGVDTPMVRGLVADRGGDTGVADLVDPAVAQNTGPLVIGQPEDIAHLVVYLASDESRYMNGAELVIDGGMAAA